MKHGLQSLYDQISCLTDTLTHLVPDVLINDNTVLVYTSEIITALQEPPLSYTEQLIDSLASNTCTHVSQAVHILVESLLQYPDWNVHVLTKGYQLTKGLQNPLSGTTHLESITHDTNNAVHIITSSSQWNHIFQCIGMRHFCTLLLHYAMFLPLTDNKSCYVQISGYSLSLGSAKISSLLHKSLSTDESSKKVSDVNHPSVRLAKVKRKIISCSCIYYGSKMKHTPSNIMTYCTKPTTDNEVKQLACAIFQDTKKLTRTWRKRILITADLLNIGQLLRNHKSCSYDHLLKNATTENYDNLTLQCCDMKSLIDKYTPLNEVKRFVTSVLHNVLPKVAWGSSRNKRILLNALLDVVGLQHQESRRMFDIVHGIKVTEYTWTRLNKGSSHVSPTQSLSNELLVCLWIKWLIDGLILPVLSKYFYVTEKGGPTRNVIFFYKKNVWSAIKLLGIKGIAEEHVFEPLLEFKDQFNNSLGISLLRFQPKTDSVRPIANLSAKTKIKSKGITTSINGQLMNTLQVLKFASCGKLGSSIIGFHEFYHKWKEFSCRKFHKSGIIKPWYMISVDIMKCYDSILVDRLLPIIQRILTQDEYCIRCYDVIEIKNGKIKKYPKRCAITSPSVPFIDTVNEQCSLYNNVIFSAADVPIKIITKEHVMNTLTSHLKNNIIKINSQHCIQTQGIPQGSILSSLLCCLYYADMEASCIDPLVEDKGFLVRLVDDFLFVTESAQLVQHFDNLMTQGIPHYNCYINHNKTNRNYVINDKGEIERLNDMSWFPWCGLLINTSNLQLLVDYSRYTNIKDCLSIHLHYQTFDSFSLKLRQAMYLRCVAHLIDSQMLSEDIVLLNVYQNFLLSAMKFHCLIRQYMRTSRDEAIATKIMSLIMKCTWQFHLQAKAVCKRRGGAYTVPIRTCNWLSLKAFHTVLKKKQSLYRPLLLLITKKLQDIHNMMDEECVDLLLETAERNSPLNNNITY